MNFNVAARIVIFIVAIILAYIMVPRVASLIIGGANFTADKIADLFRPFTLEGEARLEGLIRLCLYLVAGTLIVKYIWRK